MLLRFQNVSVNDLSSIDMTMDMVISAAINMDTENKSVKNKKKHLDVCK